MGILLWKEGAAGSELFRGNPGRATSGVWGNFFSGRIGRVPGQNGHLQRRNDTEPKRGPLYTTAIGKGDAGSGERHKETQESHRETQARGRVTGRRRLVRLGPPSEKFKAFCFPSDPHLFNTRALRFLAPATQIDTGTNVFHSLYVS